MPRLFTAIDLPTSLEEELLKLSCTIPGARWSKREQLHLTLTFIGEVESAKQLQIQKALASINATSFSVKMEGVGLFPNSKYPKVLWLGIQICSGLNELKMRIDEVLQQAIAFVPESRDYNPHLTLARLQGKSSPELTAFLKKYEALAFEAFPVQAFHLYSSQLLKTGAEYHVEQAYRLASP